MKKVILVILILGFIFGMVNSVFAADIQVQKIEAKKIILEHIMPTGSMPGEITTILTLVVQKQPGHYQLENFIIRNVPCEIITDVSVGQPIYIKVFKKSRSQKSPKIEIHLHNLDEISK